MVKINKDFHPESNFWQLNPQLIVMKPFDDLYATDDGGIDSSKYAWMCFFMSDPDEEKNIFYRINKKERLKMLKETYFPNLDPDFPAYKECLSFYPELCLTSIERSIHDQKEFIRRRDEFIKKTPYTLDELDDSRSKVHVIPGTSKQLDAMIKSTPALFKQLREMEDMWLKEKKSGEVFGGREETLTEKGLIALTPFLCLLGFL